jgi:catechol 2,3-dioxygenase-like lactoylglutathione lyase family enzyme
MNILGIDHIVLTVRDIEATVRFYQSVMGMSKETFGEGRVALKFGQQKINLHAYGNEFEPKAETPVPGSEDLCFVTETALDDAMAHVRNHGVTIIEGPVARTGAMGPILSFYFRDPDGNLIEVANYPTLDDKSGPTGSTTV